MVAPRPPALVSSAKEFPPALIMRLDASFASLIGMLKRAQLRSSGDLTAFVDTVNALDLVIQQTEEGLKELTHGLAQPPGAEPNAAVKDVIKPYRYTQRAVDFVERSEQAFLGQFIKPPTNAPAQTATAPDENATRTAREPSDAPGAPGTASHGARKTSSHTFTPTLLASVLEGTAHACGAERGALFLSDPSTPLAMSTRVEFTMPSLARVAFKSGIAHAVHIGNVGLNAFCKGHDRQCMKELNANSVLCLPLQAPGYTGKPHEGQVTGVLLLINKCHGTRGFSEDDEGVVSAACHLLHHVLNKAGAGVDVAAMLSRPEIVVMDPPLPGAQEVLAAGGVFGKPPAGELNADAPVLKGIGESAKTLRERRVASSKKRAKQQVENVAAMMDAPENRKPVRHVVKRVWDDEVTALPRPENGCCDVQLGKLVRDATSEARWVNYGWKSRARQIAESMNVQDELKADIAELQQHLLEAQIKPMQAPEEFERETALLQQVRDGIRQKAKLDDRVRRNLEKLEAERQHRESLTGDHQPHEGRRRGRSRGSFRTPSHSPAVADTTRRSIFATSPVHRQADSPRPTSPAAIFEGTRSPAHRSDSITSTFCGTKGLGDMAVAAGRIQRTSRVSASSIFVAPRPGRPARLRRASVVSDDLGGVASAGDKRESFTPSIVLSPAVGRPASPLTPQPRASMSVPTDTRQAGDALSPSVRRSRLGDAIGAVRPGDDEQSPAAPDGPSPQGPTSLLNGRLEQRLEEQSVTQSATKRTRPEAVLNRLADKLERVAELGPPVLKPPVAQGGVSTGVDADVECVTTSTESVDFSVPTRPRQTFHTSFGGPRRRMQMRPSTARSESAPTGQAQRQEEGVVSPGQGSGSEQPEGLEGWRVASQPDRDTIPEAPPAVLDVSWKKPRPPSARDASATPLKPEEGSPRTSRWDVHDEAPLRAPPGPPTLPVKKVDMAGKLGKTVVAAAAVKKRTIRGKAPMGVV